MDEVSLHLDGISRSSTIDLTAGAAKTPGSYRVDLVFTDSSGAKLGEFSEYFRLVHRRFKAALGVNQRKIRSGQNIFARVENLGTVPLIYDRWKWRLEHFSEGSWRLVFVKRSPVRASMLPGSYIAYAGMAGGCMEFRLPPAAPAGQYRIVKTIGRTGKALNLTKRVQVSGTFELRRR